MLEYNEGQSLQPLKNTFFSQDITIFLFGIQNLKEVVESPKHVMKYKNWTNR